MKDNCINRDDLTFEFVYQRWPADATALGPIREEVTRRLMPPQLGPDTHQDLVYAVSEAATKAVEHSYRPPTNDSVIELNFWTEATTLCIANTSTSSRLAHD
jgi:anti-sigma regulatory factor (Ser/Thr protein kinase)